jgi:hypothetical protein
VSLKLAISDHIPSSHSAPHPTPRLGLSFVYRNWKIALVETVSKRPRPRLVCYSAVDKVLIYALSPLPPSLFSFLLLFHTHRIICPRRRLASFVHLHFFVSSLSYIHFLITYLTAGQEIEVFTVTLVVQELLNPHSLKLSFRRSIISPQKCSSQHSLSLLSASALPLVSLKSPFLCPTQSRLTPLCSTIRRSKRPRRYRRQRKWLPHLFT